MWGLGALTLLTVENPCIIYSQLYPVPHPWIQPTMDNVVL